MCAAAAAFTGVGTVRYVAPDPWAVAAEPTRSADADRATWLGHEAWGVTANLLFLLGIASSVGVDSPTVTGNREREPETAEIVLALVAEGRTAEALTRDRELPDVLAPLWTRITTAATARAARR